MRVHFRISQNTELVPFNYQESLAGAFHKWLEWNNVHDDLSLYSLSWLKGGERSGNGLNFPNGAHWHVSSPDSNLLKKLVTRVQQDPQINYGMQVAEIILQETPKFSNQETLFVDSPVLIKRFSKEDGERQYLFNDTTSDKLLTDTIKNKLKANGQDNMKIDVTFDRSYSKAKTKLVNYKGIGNKGSICPVVLKGDPEAIGFAWNVGVGNSTGIGFGALR